MTKIYVKTKFISDDLPLKKTLQICNIIMVGRSAFHEGSKYYLQVFLGKCLNKLKLYKNPRKLIEVKTAIL